jgi:hypothetical protein
MRRWLKKVWHALGRVAHSAGPLLLGAAMWGNTSPTAEAKPVAGNPLGTFESPSKRLVLELGRPSNPEGNKLLAHWSHGSHGAHWSGGHGSHWSGGHGSHWAHGSHGSHNSGIFIPFPG